MFVQKYLKWITAVLVIALVIETALLAGLIVFFYQSGQSFPAIGLEPNILSQCPTLTPTVRDSTSGNRTVVFDCSSRGGGPALQRIRGLLNPDWSRSNYPIPMSAVPTFRLPPGYVALYLIGLFGSYYPASLSSCSGDQRIALVSGQPTVFKEPDWYYNYCAVISNSVPKAEPFTVHWSQNKPLPVIPPPVKLTASPATITVAEGENPTSTITITWLGDFRGNVSVWTSSSDSLSHTDPSERPGGPIRWGFGMNASSTSAGSLVPDSQGINTTTFTIVTARCIPGSTDYCTPRGSSRFHVYADSQFPYCTICLHGEVYTEIILNVT